MSIRSSQASAFLTTDIFIQKSELIKKVALSSGLTIKKYHEDRQKSETEVVGTYKLDKKLIEALGKVGFTFELGRKPPHDTMIYLSSNSNQRGQEVFESDCWAWERTEKDHQLTVHFELFVSEKERGIIAVPKVWGNCSGVACHRQTINKFVVAIASYFPDVHPLLKEVTTDSYPTIHWSGIGLGGVRSVATLFEELCGHNESVSRLADSGVSPFIPIPKEAGHNYFVTESDQPRLFEQWRRQLLEYKNRLG